MNSSSKSLLIGFSVCGFLSIIPKAFILFYEYSTLKAEKESIMRINNQAILRIQNQLIRILASVDPAQREPVFYFI